MAYIATFLIGVIVGMVGMSIMCAARCTDCEYRDELARLETKIMEEQSHDTVRKGMEAMNL